MIHVRNVALHYENPGALESRGVNTLTESMGMLKPTPELPPRPEGSAMAVLMPISLPRLSSKGPENHMHGCQHPMWALQSRRAAGAKQYIGTNVSHSTLLTEV